MIEVLINDKAQKVAIDASIAELVSQFAGSGPFAVALNGEFVGKENYGKTMVSDKDKIDILSPIQGG